MIVNGMPAAELGDLAWSEERAEQFAGNCVELARLDAHGGGAGLVGMRDSKDPGGPALIFPAAEIGAWVADLKAGRYDDLIHC
jgi:hypothetical protein